MKTAADRYCSYCGEKLVEAEGNRYDTMTGKKILVLRCPRRGEFLAELHRSIENRKKRIDERNRNRSWLQRILGFEYSGSYFSIEMDNLWRERAVLEDNKHDEVLK